MNQSPRGHTCVIEQVGKARNGKPRYWCRTHQSSATGRFGIRLAECEGAYRDIELSGALHLDETRYPGGIALWGAVPAVYDTTNLPPELGIHVHAREQTGGEKEIDATFPAVIVHDKRDLFADRQIVITAETAVNYYLSRFIGQNIKHLFCTYCGELHLDAGYFAVHPHRRHLCHACGRYFHDEDRGISNPIDYVRKLRGDTDSNRKLVGAKHPLEIKQADYPGGIQIWASNPAIVWTSEKAEEEGIHVHLYDAGRSEPVTDETFSAVRIDGIELNPRMVQCLMAQNAVGYLKGKLVSLDCPKCGRPHFDDVPLAFNPHKEHDCEHCGEKFATPGSRRLVVSNPLVATLEKLRASAPPTTKIENQ